MRFALGLEYFGAEFCGWQTQPSGCGVQDAVESALSKMAEQKISIVAAGRTDTGVHAIEQVVHFDTQADRPLSAWVRGSNAYLPPSISALWAQPVSDDFHARFSACQRHYTYVLLNRATRPGLRAGRVGWYHRPLNVGAMVIAARHLIGRHDFSAFRSAECQAKSPVKTLAELRIERRGEFVMFHFSADAFLHHMVRNIVGCLVYVGDGHYGADWLQSLLASKDRRLAAPTFMPDGLYLSRIEYGPGWTLPRREGIEFSDVLADLVVAS